MQALFFCLGRTPQLSSAEICSVLNSFGIKFQLKSYSSEVMIVEIDRETNLDLVMKKLGGTIKIGRIIDFVDFDDSEEKFDRVLSEENLIEKYLNNKKGKIRFGISIYHNSKDNSYAKKLENRMKEICKKIKANINGKGISAGFLPPSERILSSATIHFNKLVTDGFELILIVTDEGILFGKTSNIQEFQKFAFRDYYRPNKDRKSGIIPPKLARMMINLSDIPKEGYLLDPFCGSGTILQEAIMLRIRHITGSDISKKAISDTFRNMEWLFRSITEISRKDIDLSIKIADARDKRTHTHFLFDAIVTEPYLGPSLHRSPGYKEAERIISDLKPLYIESFRSFASFIKPGGKIVIIFPYFDLESRIYRLDILPELERIGFVSQPLLPDNFPDKNKIRENSVIYGDNSTYVRREIHKFQKILSTA